MPHANSEAFSKAAGLRSSKHRHKRQTTHICPSRTVRVSTTESITEVPDVDQLRKARTEFYEKSPDKRNKSPNREMTYISESRATQAGPREASRKSSGGSQHGSQRKAHGRHRHHRKVDDVERDREIVYVYRHAGREERTQATAISQDLPSRTTAATRRQSRSTISDHKRQDSQGQSRRRHTSLIDVASKPSTHTRDSVGETDKNHERSLRRSATSNRYAGRGAVLTDHPRVIRSSSMRERSLPPTRPPLQRSNTSVRSKTRPVAQAQSQALPVRERPENLSTNTKESGRGSRIVYSLFGIPSVVPPDLRVQCLTCLSDDILSSKSAKLGCGHSMCHDCLKRIFTMSVTDPQHMPPRCCTQDHIPLKHVDRLFDTKFKMKWNKKYQEYTTKNRIYCPAKGCGEWIKPSHIHTDPNNGRKYGRCGRCKLKVCCKCNGKWHSGKDCPKDEDTKRFVEIAKKEGWQRCFNCSAMVELKEGCNHMTCRCTAEFCMICGLKWKTCSCPWFNYEAVENDRLNHMNIPEARRVLAEAGRNNVPRAYHEELGRRRDQERLDEAFARRLVLGLDGDGEDLDNGNEVDDDDGDGNSHTETGNQGAFFEAGNTAGHFLNQDFVRRTTHVLGRNIGQIANAAEDLVAEHYHHLGVQGPDGSPVRERRHHAYGPPSRGRVSDASQLSPLVRTYSAARASDRNATRRTDTAPATAMDYLTEDAGTAGHQRAHDRDRDRRRPSAMAGLTARTPSGRIGSWLDHIDIDDGDGGRRVIPVR